MDDKAQIELQPYVRQLTMVGDKLERFEQTMQEIKLTVATLAKSEEVAELKTRLAVVEQRQLQGDGSTARWVTAAICLLGALIGVVGPHIRFH